MPKIVMVTKMRNGSKRFPEKNTALLFGFPLYQYTFNFAKQFSYPYYVLHNYNNMEFPEWAIDIELPDKYCRDYHITNMAIKWANIEADIYMLLQVTSPLRSALQVEQAIGSFIAGDYDCGFNAKRIKEGYYYNAIGKGLNFKQKERTFNGCNKQIVFKETGSLYIFKRKMLDKKHILDSDKKIIFDDPFDIDINTEEDLKAIECRLK